MRKLLAALVAFSVATAWAQSQFYNGTISVTDTNTTVAFTDNGSGGSGRGIAARHVLIRSASSSDDNCFFDLKDTTATTADMVLEPGAGVVLEFDTSSASPGQDGWTGMGVICASAETAIFYITATR